MHSLPNLIIAGANRCGTTSLYTYLSQHPEICASSIKETNYFVPVLYGNSLPPIETYASYFQDCKQRKYRMEASPRYFFGGRRLAEEIRRCLGTTRILFLFRQPIERLVSYFKQMKRAQELPPRMTCDDYARRALEELRAAIDESDGKPLNVYKESIYVRGLAQGFYADYLEEWYCVFPNSIKACFLETLKKDPRQVVRGLCEDLGINPFVYENSEFSQENRSMVDQSEILYAVASFVNQRGESFWRRHTRMKKWARHIYSWLNESHSNSVDLSEERRAHLESVYAPYNKRLLKILAERGYRNLPEWLSSYACI